MKTKYSQKYFKESERVLVGGVNSPVRSFNSVGGNPLVIKYGKRAQFYDYDNNSFTDYCLSWGALIHGHANKNIVLAAKKTLEKGMSFGTTTREEISIAEFIVKSVPSIDQIRFVNSGTESTMSAIRLARGFTGRDIVVKFDGCYHGHSDDLLTTAGSGVANLNESSSLGVPKNHIQNTISLPYNDSEILSKTLIAYAKEIACVIIEPVAGNMGVIPAQKEFLKLLRELTKKHGIVLIFDEVMSGFRTGLGCVQSDYEITPDLTCLGKIIGSGFPVGAYGGKKEIMKFLAPLGRVYQAGTFSGNPVVMKAGFAGLQLLDLNFYKKLNQKSNDFAIDLNVFFKENSINAHLSHYKGMMSIRFCKSTVLNYVDAQNASNNEIYGRLFNFLLECGIYLPPADLESFFICAAHSQKNLEHLLNSIKKFFTNYESK